MKKIKIIVVLILAVAAISGANAQTTKQEKKAAKITAVKNMVDSQRYIFEADYVIPLRGGSRNLTSEYDLKVVKDSVIAFLPYFGRAYVAPNTPNPLEGGIKFTSTNFDYKKSLKKNGTWQISIKPRDKNITDWRDVQQLTLNISTDGYATLDVLSSNRDAISFNGYITQAKVNGEGQNDKDAKPQVDK